MSKLSPHPSSSTELAVPDRETRAAIAEHEGNSRESLAPWHRLALLRELAAADTKHAILAKKYGMSPQSLSNYAKRYASEIEDIRENFADQFAGMPLAKKANRIMAYMEEIERLNNHPNGDHFEWSKARQNALRNIAEELAQLPPRQQVTVIPVAHVIEGINLDDL